MGGARIGGGKKVKITPLYRDMVEFKVMGGKSGREVAKELGVDVSTIIRAYKRPEVIEYEKRIEAERERRYMEAYSKALDVVMGGAVECIVELKEIALHGSNEGVRRYACRDIAYMAGLKPREAESIGKVPKLEIEEATPEQKKETKIA